MRQFTIGWQAYKKVLFIIMIVAFFITCYTFTTISVTQNRNNNTNNNKAKQKHARALGDQMLPRHEQKKWFVYNSQCKIEYMDPFSKELLAMYAPPTFVPCTREFDLVTPVYDAAHRRYLLHVNEDVAKGLLNSSVQQFNCYYQEIEYTHDAEENAEPLPPKYFTQDFVVPLHIESMLVTCHRLSSATEVLQRDAFYFVQDKLSEAKPSGKSKQQTPRKPSVIMFGIDSLSRINFRRTMPKVFELLNQRGWYELQGYNKVADNTFPNLLAVLSGYTTDSAKQICDTSEPGCLDRFPFIWSYFKNASYLTAYAEDETAIGTFNYFKPGFQRPPVDYYFRPFLKVIERKMYVYRYRNSGLRYCIGRRLTCSYIYDFCQQYMKRFVAEHPIFGLFWTSSFSHDSYDKPAMMADRILQYLLDFETDGALESTIMIFFSDHGMRFEDPLLDLPEGFYEERLPFLFIWLPAWFRAQYPEYANALDLNRNRLTSNYDLHMTLKHIIELGSANKIKLPQAADCPRCQTLFEPVPHNRTCTDAGIIDHWCSCHTYEEVSSQNYASVIIPLILDRMNSYLAAKNFADLCSDLTLNYTYSIDRKLPSKKIGINLLGHSHIYRAKFKVNPNGAKFQATVYFNIHNKKLGLNVETISRLNKYREDSLCVNDKEAKKYCICYNSTNTISL